MRRPCPTRSAPTTSRTTAALVLVSRVALQLMRVYAKLAILNTLASRGTSAASRRRRMRLGPEDLSRRRSRAAAPPLTTALETLDKYREFLSNECGDGCMARTSAGKDGVDKLCNGFQAMFLRFALEEIHGITYQQAALRASVVGDRLWDHMVDWVRRAANNDALSALLKDPHGLQHNLPDHELWAPLVAELDYELTIIRDYEQLECTPLGSLPLPGKPECFAKGLTNSQIALMAQVVDLERDCNTKRLKAIRYGNAHPQGRDPVVRVSCASKEEATEALQQYNTYRKLLNDAVLAYAVLCTVYDMGLKSPRAFKQIKKGFRLVPQVDEAVGGAIRKNYAHTDVRTRAWAAHSTSAAKVDHELVRERAAREERRAKEAAEAAKREEEKARLKEQRREENRRRDEEKKAQRRQQQQQQQQDEPAADDQETKDQRGGGGRRRQASSSSSRSGLAHNVAKARDRAQAQVLLDKATKACEAEAAKAAAKSSAKTKKGGAKAEAAPPPMYKAALQKRGEADAALRVAQVGLETLEQQLAALGIEA